jgi:hypothetical protein
MSPLNFEHANFKQQAKKYRSSSVIGVFGCKSAKQVFQLFGVDLQACSH